MPSQLGLRAAHCMCVGPPLLLPLCTALRRGACVLIACANGRHRSAQLAALILYGVLDDFDSALNHVWVRRHLAEWIPLPGP